MASLRSCVANEADIIRDGIGWAVFWKQGRSWFSAYMHPFLKDDETFEFEFEPEDLESLKDILKRDPNAVMLNGCYCGHLGENSTIAQLEQGVRWHYENGYNLLSEWTELQEEEEEPVIENTESVIESTENVIESNETVIENDKSVISNRENVSPIKTASLSIKTPVLTNDKKCGNRCRDG